MDENTAIVDQSLDDLCSVLARNVVHQVDQYMEMRGERLNSTEIKGPGGYNSLMENLNELILYWQEPVDSNGIIDWGIINIVSLIWCKILAANADSIQPNIPEKI